MKIAIDSIKLGLQNQRSGVVTYQCDVYIDGRKIAFAEEEGRGGCLNIHPIEPFVENRQILANAGEFFKTQPSLWFEGFSDIEEQINFLVEEYEIQLVVKKHQKKYIVWVSADKKLKTAGWKNLNLSNLLETNEFDKLIRDLILKLKKENPGCKILNTNLQKFEDVIAG